MPTKPSRTQTAKLAKRVEFLTTHDEFKLYVKRAKLASKKLGEWIRHELKTKPD